MMTPRIAAVLLVANTAVVVVGVLSAGGSVGIERPFWLPPLWVRAVIPLAVAGGLWLGKRWAWWIAVTMCGGELLWVGVASVIVALGGYFTGGGAVLRALHVGLLVGTWLAALALLLSRPGRAKGRP